MNDTIQQDEVRRQVRETYGTIAQNNGRGCGCGPAAGGLAGTDPKQLGYHQEDLASVPEGSEMGLGCGNPTAIASIAAGETILDLGSGAGFDCFLAANQTGPSGQVIGVDMTAAMITKARENAAKGAYPNVDFRLGEIENLPVADNTIDLIISNCVINLSPDKPRVFAEAFRVLKSLGRIAVSDIVALKPLTDDVKSDITAYVGCVAGASSPAEIEIMLRSAGFGNVRVEVKAASRDFIDQWQRDKNLGDYIASANITAVKPAAPCCGTSCCSEEDS